MPKISIMRKELFYETYGEGEPIIFLNGIMMSTLSWKPFIKAFSKYKMILLDLIDQGNSDKADSEYDQLLHVEMLKELLNQLGYEKVHMLGISYGGEVAMKFASKYGNRLTSLILSNTTAKTTNIMKDIEAAWDYAASTHDGTIFFKATMPFIYSRKFYEENDCWLAKREEILSKSLTQEWYEGFRRAIKSASNHNEMEKLSEIEVPTLVIGADLDILTPIAYQQFIYENIKNCKMIILKDAGHASMYEKPYEFAGSILGFLESYDKEIKIV
jgi:3-oxoadipate enol-lactonase